MSNRRYGVPRKRANPTGISGGLRHLMKRDRNLCHFCGKKVAPEEATRSHLIARAHGGPASKTNLALAHAACNVANGRRPVLDVRATDRGWRKREAPKGLTTRTDSNV